LEPVPSEQGSCAEQTQNIIDISINSIDILTNSTDICGNLNDILSLFCVISQFVLRLCPVCAAVLSGFVCGSPRVAVNTWQSGGEAWF
jgi:hypothetical protein